MSTDNSNVMDRVRKALGRAAPLQTPPIPPEIDEAITRLAGPTADLGELFSRMCEENKMHVESVQSSELSARLTEFLNSQNVRRIALSGGGIIESQGILAALRQAGFDAKIWTEMSLDDLYDFDCGVTDVYSAVAETGTLVMRASVNHGRALSLVPALHVAIVERRQIVPDLIDLFAKLGTEGCGSAVSLITGPSKTSDIEMNLVIGVHGPMKVQVFSVS